MTIFLDIDGVLIPAKSWETPVLLRDGFPDFTASSVSVLRKIISHSTKVVLTSSHRSRFSLEEWRQIFKIRGIQLSYIERLDDNQEGVSRREEMLNWFNRNHSINDFIIIDDDSSLNDLPSDFKNRLISTSSFIGLTENHLNLITDLINDAVLP